MKIDITQCLDNLNLVYVDMVESGIFDFVISPSIQIFSDESGIADIEAQMTVDGNSGLVRYSFEWKTGENPNEAIKRRVADWLAAQETQEDE